MIKLWKFVRTEFITKKFITFGIIGVLNTGIHMSIYWLIYEKVIFSSAFWANSFAFIGASTFSYFANAFFTFKPKQRTYKQFSYVILVFLIRLLISSSLASLFDYMVINWFNVDYNLIPIAKFIAPFFASALLIPIAYFALDYVFKKTDIIKKEL